MPSYVNWVEIYEAYTNDQLETELAELRKAASGSQFTSQTVSGGGGSQSYTQDPQTITARLQAATRVKNQRHAGNTGRGGYVGQADMSGGVNGSGGAGGRRPC